MPNQPVLLLVDSDNAARRAAAALLRESGHAVVEARNGLEGLRMAREHAPALVILDPWPFVAAAAQMLARMRQQPATADSAILLLTTVTFHRIPPRAPFTQIRFSLGKPCASSELLRAVDSLLEARGPGEPGEPPRVQAGS